MALGRSGGREACTSCERPVVEGQKLCECGAATGYMSFDERASHEVAEWRAYRERAGEAS